MPCACGNYMFRILSDRIPDDPNAAFGSSYVVVEPSRSNYTSMRPCPYTRLGDNLRSMAIAKRVGYAFVLSS